MSKVRQLITHTETKAILATPVLEAELPGIASAFEDVDEKFVEDQRGYLQGLEESQFVVQRNGAKVNCSLLMNGGRQKNELLVIFAPFSDSAPKSSAETMYHYIRGDAAVKRGTAKPNSWSQTVKSAVTTDLLDSFGHGMPALTIFAPIPSRAYSRADRQAIRRGDFTPAAEVLRAAIDSAQSRVHGLDSETQFTKLHISGASLGASNAIGAAVNLMNRDHEIESVTTQELVFGPRNLPDLAKRFTFGGLTGESSRLTFPSYARSIAEPLLRRLIDQNGSEPIGMNIRMLQGASKLSYMTGLTKPEYTVEAIEKLLDNGVNLLAARAINSTMSDRSKELLPAEVRKLYITPQEGHKLGHIVDEHVAVSALVMALNVVRTHRGVRS